MAQSASDEPPQASADFLRVAVRPGAAPALCWTNFLSADDMAVVLHEAQRLVRCPGGGCTHFIASGDTPVCQLESMAIAVATWHMSRCDNRCCTRGSDFGFGAEWWVQIREPNEPLSTHWDCDEYLKSETGEHIPPYVATVTYLTAVGAPTLVLPVAADSNGRAFAATAAPLSAFTSFPVRGKHLAFDGRLLHGAPYDGPVEEEEGAAADASPPSAAPLRVTILINLWIDHCPKGVERLPLPLVAAITGHREISIDDDDDDDEERQIARPPPPPAPPMIVGASASVAPPHHVPSLEDDAEWREFSIGSFHHQPVSLRPLDDLWTRPDESAHFLLYAPSELRLPADGDGVVGEADGGGSDA